MLLKKVIPDSMGIDKWKVYTKKFELRNWNQNEMFNIFSIFSQKFQKILAKSKHKA